ncbi:MAG: acyltransferase [Rhodobacteraceae bacterium]|nr:acyltransferase [Paracoccaceae bacterium]
MKQGQGYRGDLDGLRAIAVVSVVAFHLDPKLLPGGFLGVDVFFVISGFLMTQKVVTGLEERRFNFADYLVRRARRIVPALLAWCFISLCVGVFMLGPDDLLDLAKSALTAVMFVSNVYFYANTGYFDADAASMPLLHTWSLGVEGQFYLLWPVLLVAGALFLKRRTSLGFAPWILAILVISFLYDLYLRSSDPQMAFFLPFSRLWEFGAGGLIAAGSGPIHAYLSSRSRIATTISRVCVAVLVSVILAFGWLSEHSALLSFVCVLATALLIAVGRYQDRHGNPLCFGPIRGLGIISYSLYLAHWPIIVFYHHYTGFERLRLSEQAVLLALILLAGALSWRFIETPFRSKPNGWLKPVLGVLATTGFGLTAVVIMMTSGLPGRLPVELRDLADRDVMWSWECPHPTNGLLSGKACVVGVPWTEARQRAILWGDSHALHYAPLIDLAARDSDVAVLVAYGCPAVVDNRIAARTIESRPEYSKECAADRAEILDLIANQGVDQLLLAAFWSSLPRHLHGPTEIPGGSDGLDLFRRALMAIVVEPSLSHTSIVFLGEVPRGEHNLLDCYRRVSARLLRRPCDLDVLALPRSVVDRLHGPTRNILASVGSSNDNVRFHDVDDLWCTEASCPTTLNGEFLYRDSHHIRRNLSDETKAELSGLLRLRDIFIPDRSNEP